jgi:D-glycero-alpha-D-manno-heptose-7-phosphate kinase
MSLKINSKAPTRIDLAGGTVDIWPIYLFLDKPVTLNLGIDLFAEAYLEVFENSKTPGVTLRSDDQKEESRLSWEQVETAKAHPALDLHLRLLRHFSHAARERLGDEAFFRQDLRLKTVARSPSGAGLGGSSTLNVAITGTLASWAWDRKFDPMVDGEKLIEIARDVETTVIHVPAGLQDYYGAMFGGLQSLNWGAGVHRREWLDTAILPGLESRMLLFYSGQSRNSGINNWLLYKNFIDKEAQVRDKFAALSQSAHNVQNALTKGDWAAAGLAINEEWATRKTLAAGISTPEIDKAFAIAREIVPSSAAKICGAGGGGCFFIYLPGGLPEGSDAQRKRIVVEFAKLGIKHLPFKPVPKGLELQVTRT